MSELEKTADFKSVTRFECDINYGLNSDQVKKRKAQGLFNYEVKPKFKTTGQILRSNIFTYFNIINFILAICVIAVGSIKNVFFIGVVISNIFIGILQEFKVRNIVKKLSIVSQPVVTVVREGKQTQIDISEIVLDDIVVLNSGNQIVADSTIKKGQIEVNESLITGESDMILKKEGDKLISGSFVVSGSCFSRVEKIGESSYVSKILMDVGQYKSTKNKSEMMKYINTLIKIVGAVIGPIGILRFYKEYFSLHNNLKDSVVFTVASVIGMIPEGIVLLTSITLMLGVLRLAKLHTLTQDLFCLETLAKVDILCLDKTGTLTEGDIVVDDVIDIDEKYNIEYIRKILHNLCVSTEDKGSTIEGLKKEFINKDLYKDELEVKNRVYFSSDRKWSGINFKDNVNIALGAPEILLKDKIKKYSSLMNKYLDQGKRILVVGLSDEILSKEKIPKITPIAFIIMSDKIRDSARETLKFFEDQGVNIKIISGDNAASVSRIAKAVNLKENDKYVDASHIKSEADMIEAVKKYTVFGRTKPEQKRELIKAYQKLGHQVGMIGDGVNDILALKEADCSIAMAEGSDAARQISKFVLLDSNFKSIPTIVNEGRRVVNNITRSASMFLIRNIYSFALSLILLFISSSYPFQPIQLTLLGLTIGLPSFFLVLEPNKEPIKGSFFKKVLKNALPPAIAIITNILFINIISNYIIDLTSEEISTIAVILTGLCNIMALIKISNQNKISHKLIAGIFALVFILAVIFLKDIFLLTNINLKIFLVVLILSVCNYLEINIQKIFGKHNVWQQYI